MPQKKKLTRQQKTEYTDKGICWKCKKELTKKENTLICENCGISIETH